MFNPEQSVPLTFCERRFTILSEDISSLLAFEARKEKIA